MRLRDRFLLIGLGMVIFTLTAPVIVLFALGYKLDLENWRIVQTGSLIVKTEPEGARIFLNGEIQRSDSDATLRFLLPGDYDLRLELDGFQPWSKRLNIRSRLVTWANFERDFIALFYTQPELNRRLNISQAAVSGHSGHAVIMVGAELQLLDGQRGQLAGLPGAALDFPEPTMLPPQALYYLLRYEPARAFPNQILENVQKLQANEKHALALSGGELLAAGKPEPLASGVTGFLLQDGHAWFVQGQSLMHANLDIGVIEPVIELPLSASRSEIIRGDSRLFLVLNQRLYAINDQAEEISGNVSYAHWNSAARKLVYGNSHEVSVYDPLTLQSALIIRSSSAVGNPVLNRETGYLFYSNEGQVKAIEMDGRDHRNSYSVAPLPSGSYFIDENGRRLFVITDTELLEYQIRP